MDPKIRLLDSTFGTCKDRSVINYDNAETWLNIAEALLKKHMQNHDGGFEFQVEILNAFQHVELLTKERRMIYHSMKGKGLILRMMGNGEESAIAFEIMLKYSSTSSEKVLASHLYGLSLQIINQIDRSISFFREALRECPDALDIYLPLTESLLEKKRSSTKNLTKWYVEILINVMRAFLKSRIPADENDIVERSLITSIILPTTAFQSRNLIQLPCDLFYAFHKIAHELGEYNLGWKHLCIAHRIQSLARAPYDPERYRTHLSCIKRVFCKEFMENKENFNKLRDDSNSAVSTKPIFIVGMMRSGSTLLELLLDSHSKIIGLGEDSVLNNMLPEFRNSFLDAAKSQQSVMPNTDQMSNDLHHESDVWSNEFHFQLSTKSQLVIQEYSTMIEKRMLDRTAFIQNLPHQKKKILYNINARESFENNANTEETNCTNRVYMVDKMLFNYRSLGFVHMLFPDAVILNLVRDPMDTLLSCLRNKFDGNDLEWTLHPLHLGNEYVRYLDYIAHWKQVLPTGSIMDIQYEALVSSPEQVLKSIIEDTLHLQWETDILVNAQAMSHHKPVLTNSMTQARQCITTSNIGSWKNYADCMQPLIDSLRPDLFKRLANGDLPYAITTNWGLNKSFVYNNSINYENKINTCEAKNNQGSIEVDVDDKTYGSYMNESIFCMNDSVNFNSKLNKDIILSLISKKIIPLKLSTKI